MYITVVVFSQVDDALVLLVGGLNAPGFFLQVLQDVDVLIQQPMQPLALVLSTVPLLLQTPNLIYFSSIPCCSTSC